MHSNFTSIDTLQRLLARYGATIRYAPSWGWLIWSGTHWQLQDSAHITHCAIETVLSLFADIDALPAESDPSQRTLLAQQANRSATIAGLKALVDLVRVDSAVLISRDSFDPDPFLLAVNNGTLNLRTGQLKPHDPLDYITRFIPIDYDPQATSSCWDTFLDQVTNHDQPLQHYLQRAVGYTLTGCTQEDALFLLYGPGCNGKSTFLRALHALLGTYAQPGDTHLLTHKGAARSHATLSALLGTRCLTVANLEPDDILDLNLIKRITSGEPLFVRTAASEPLVIVPRFKLWFTSNHLPQLQEHSNAIWRRLKLIPFTVSFADQETKDLSEQLQLAAPALLAWAVEGCLQWQRHGLQEPPAITRATRAYRNETNQLSAFMFNQCTHGPDDRVSADALYKSYRSWCDITQQPSLSQNLFGRRLFALGFQREHTWVGNVYRGIGLGAALSQAECTYLDIGINLPADSSPQKDHSKFIATFNTALAEQSRPKPAPPSPFLFSFPSSSPVPPPPSSAVPAELAHLELLVKRELMTPLPSFTPTNHTPLTLSPKHTPLTLSPNPTPEASEPSHDNTSTLPSNNPPEEPAPSKPIPEVSEAFCGNTFILPSTGTHIATPEENALNLTPEPSRGNTSALPSNNPPEEPAPFNPTPEASEPSRGNAFNASPDTMPETSEPSAGNFLIITGAIHEEIQQNEKPFTSA